MPKEIEQTPQDYVSEIDAEIGKLSEIIGSEYHYKTTIDKNQKIAFYLISGEVMLDITFDSPIEFFSVIALTKKILNIYKKEGYINEKFDIQESLLSKDYDKIDLIVEKLGFDTTILTDESFRKVFGRTPGGIDGPMKKYADFLNAIIQEKK